MPDIYINKPIKRDIAETIIALIKKAKEVGTNNKIIKLKTEIHSLFDPVSAGEIIELEDGNIYKLITSDKPH